MTFNVLSEYLTNLRPQISIHELLEQSVDDVVVDVDHVERLDPTVRLHHHLANPGLDKSALSLGKNELKGVICISNFRQTKFVTDKSTII